MTDKVESAALRGAGQVVAEDNKRMETFSSLSPAGPQVVCKPGQCERYNRMRDALSNALGFIEICAGNIDPIAGEILAQGYAALKEDQ